MTELASPDYLTGGLSCGKVAAFSPDGLEFVVVLRRGNVERGSNDYTMLQWKTNEVASERPRILLHWESQTVDPAIDPDSLAWSSDGHSLVFLGHTGGSEQQAFQLELKTHTLRELTKDPTGVTSYDADSNGGLAAYEALPPAESLWGEGTTRRGLVVTTQRLGELIAGEKAHGVLGRRGERRLFIESGRGLREVTALPGSVLDGDPWGRDEGAVSVSPSGQYVVVPENLLVSHVPGAWRGYRDYIVRLMLSGLGKFERSEDSYLSRYVLVDTNSGRSRVLLNVPVFGFAHLVWSRDSRSVVISDSLLPLRADSSDQERMEASQRTAVEVNVEGGIARRIPGCSTAIAWRGGILTCVADSMLLKLLRHVSGKAPRPDRHGCSDAEVIGVRKAGKGWRRAEGLVSSRLDVYLKEGMNDPPELYYKRAAQKRGRLLWNLNPQLSDVLLSKERLIKWRLSTGRSVSGGLYWPVNYQQGHRYPLVIQTHGFSPDRFAFFGPFSTAYAAQPLAARGMFVLQLDDTWTPPEDAAGRGQLKEIDSAIAVYRSAIAYLSQQHLIDPRRVGIIGFSVSGLYVKWALVHDPGVFSAASVTESQSGGYFEYMAGYNDVDVRSLYGGPPFGRFLKAWIRLSPSFNLEHVRSPLLMTVLDPRNVFQDWAWLQGLRDLGKPVFMIMLDGHDFHELQQPWNRSISSGDNVEWFDFWLNGHESKDSASTWMYRLWEGLCDNQMALNPDRRLPCIPTARRVETATRGSTQP
ncbi:MAG: alpha/beta hydrolase family protein [Steroidobacteraceae bacterium]